MTHKRMTTIRHWWSRWVAGEATAHIQQETITLSLTKTYDEWRQERPGWQRIVGFLVTVSDECNESTSGPNPMYFPLIEASLIFFFFFFFLLFLFFLPSRSLVAKSFLTLHPCSSSTSIDMTKTRRREHTNKSNEQLTIRPNKFPDET